MTAENIVTVYRVAQEAKVGTGTVSAVINNKTHEYGEPTGVRVREVIERLGWTPNPDAQRVARGRYPNDEGLADAARRLHGLRGRAARDQALKTP